MNSRIKEMYTRAQQVLAAGDDFFMKIGIRSTPPDRSEGIPMNGELVKLSINLTEYDNEP